MGSVLAIRTLIRGGHLEHITKETQDIPPRFQHGPRQKVTLKTEYPRAQIHGCHVSKNDERSETLFGQRAGATVTGWMKTSPRRNRMDEAASIGNRAGLFQLSIPVAGTCSDVAMRTNRDGAAEYSSAQREASFFRLLKEITLGQGHTIGIENKAGVVTPQARCIHTLAVHQIGGTSPRENGRFQTFRKLLKVGR